MKNNSGLFIPIILLAYFYTTETYAQFTLVDSFEFTKKTSVIVTDRSPDQPSLFMLRRAWMSVEGRDARNEIVVRGKYIIRTPKYATPIYLDDQYIYFDQFVRGNPARDEPGKYIDGHNVLSKYSVSKEGELTLIDSVALPEDALTIHYEGSLPTVPIIITCPLAVEGGSCNGLYTVYDENLQVKETIAPQWEICGTVGGVYIDRERVHLVDLNEDRQNMVSWYICDLKLDDVIDRSFHPKFEDGFHVYTAFVENGLLQISGWKRIDEHTIASIYIYTPQGKLVERIDVPDSNPVSNIYKRGKQTVFFNSGVHSVTIRNDQNTKGKKNNFSAPTAYVSGKLVVYKEDKILLYKID